MTEPSRPPETARALLPDPRPDTGHGPSRTPR